MATAKAKMTSLSFDAAIQRTPTNIGITVIYPHKLESLRFIQILVMGSKKQAHNVTE